MHMCQRLSKVLQIVHSGQSPKAQSAFGGSVDFMVKKIFVRPILETNAASKEVPGLVVCFIFGDKVKKRIAKKGMSLSQLMRMTQAQLDKETAKLNTNPSMFTAVKIMCCTKTSCKTAKKCTHPNTKICIAHYEITASRRIVILRGSAREAEA